MPQGKLSRSKRRKQLIAQVIKRHEERLADLEEEYASCKDTYMRVRLLCRQRQIQDILMDLILIESVS